jgi:hypothetical protein
MPEDAAVQRSEVGRLDPYQPARLNQFGGLDEDAERVGDVLDQVQHQDEVEAPLGIELFDRPREPLQPAGARDRDAALVGIDYQPGGPISLTDEDRGDLARSASDVEDPRAGGAKQGEDSPIAPRIEPLLDLEDKAWVSGASGCERVVRRRIDLAEPVDR